jgi:hypothetical protein
MENPPPPILAPAVFRKTINHTRNRRPEIKKFKLYRCYHYFNCHTWQEGIMNTELNQLNSPKPQV